MHGKTAPSTPRSRNSSKQSLQHCCKWRHKKETALKKRDQDLLGRTRSALSFAFLFVFILPLPLYLLPKKGHFTLENRLGSSVVSCPTRQRTEKCSIAMCQIFWKDFPFGLSIEFVFFFVFNTWRLLRDRQDDFTLEETDA